ncbi:tRNA (guanosine(37)-N1)-methyltransferase TrmD [Meiothermus ruber]|jgi:tRNA (guanine37-N1)-methyltransferase|uniref:tRNA (guanine-N(1)-)-methyltransferase n=1 Tax=Meiothermus ruber (strain ATCC 35948 / DSM 1279 / VKM B-1258 / 21) TaxID=504728 RepID=D3PQP2_MEIRD|nr:tRNA (guanosine(37)-N1)-methyltransferase TrmD [Meiothermus ruber]ADD27775.1 tRNA (guanine-N1)-methyltransferase [Meiothermus ruber DSM 1279]AGK04240.1 tRNA (guanine-N(1)-)-methyltransferase [Meiothermus ruber DSM 1279]MCL6530713.1 tRNA (guanosine(37)-N1)-methyltransferase TrmD [Meiothermus ruber]GAO74703.1 tRNA (guanine-N1)-methyltransferase [Meiothermus ruber H328]
MKYTILTLFPDLVRPWTEESIVQKAIQKGLIEVDIRDIRAYTEDKHKTVDDTPYGGGAGMVMRVDVVVRAIEAAGSADEVILLTPAGQPLTQRLVEELAGKSHLVLVCGRYEGIDARVEHFVTREISIGDYVLMGGELGALVILEATARLLPGVIKEAESHRQDSFSTGLLDYPHYTRPPVFRGLAVPEILTSGHHAKIAEWRRKQALKRTKARRPDLLERAELTPKDLVWLEESDFDN